MYAIKAHFDGENIILPDEARSLVAGDVIVVFEDGSAPGAEREGWLKAQEQTLAKVWDNADDDIYDTL